MVFPPAVDWNLTWEKANGLTKVAREAVAVLNAVLEIIVMSVA